MVITVRYSLMAMRLIMEVTVMVIGIMLNYQACSAVMCVHIVGNTVPVAIAFAVIRRANILAFHPGVMITAVMGARPPAPTAYIVPAAAPLNKIFSRKGYRQSMGAGFRTYRRSFKP